MNTSPRTLTQWLDYIERVHPVGIDLGLERIARVAERMGFERPGFRCAPRSVIVAGTNGKGSTCIALEAVLGAAGVRVGTTMSPHLHVFNERVRIDGRAADDATLCAAFARVDAARGDVPLTYFEFSALVALDCFRRGGVDVAVLEVGLGGRLDAFNLVDADVAVITSISLEHQAYLGDDLESIGREKAGVMRPRQRVVLGADVTRSVIDAATALQCVQSRLGVDFHVSQRAREWDHDGTGARRFHHLPISSLAPDNWALALEAAGHLVDLPGHRIASLVASVTLAGRMEPWRVGPPDHSRPLLLDVAHNPAGARFLRRQLERRHPNRRFVAVVGLLADKDAAGVAAAMEDRVRLWVCVPTRGARGLPATALAERLGTVAGVRGRCITARDARHGLECALSSCQSGDGILAFGSFDLVEQMREVLLARHEGAVPDATARAAATEDDRR